jgi:ribonuclease HI
MVYFNQATLRFDGSCVPNPGEGGSGYVIFDGKVPIIKGHHYVGKDCTNNVAEYFGLIQGLKELQESPHKIGHLTIEGDSEVVINQMKNIYKVSSRRLKPLRHKARKILERCSGREFDSYSFRHINREQNVEADRLANEARNEELRWSKDYYK